MIEKADDEVFDEDFVKVLECLPSTGDEFSDNSVVLPSAGNGVILAEVVRFSSDSDKSPAGRLVEAVFG